MTDWQVTELKKFTKTMSLLRSNKGKTLCAVQDKSGLALVRTADPVLDELVSKGEYRVIASFKDGKEI